jgi:hypothetical protein
MCLKENLQTPTPEKLLLKFIEEIENVAPRFTESKKLDDHSFRHRRLDIFIIY